MTTSLPRRAIPASNALFQDLEGEAIILDLESEIYFGLDEVGARIWQLLGEHEETETVLAQVLAEYDVDEATLRQDFAALLDQLAAAGLITVAA